jgi:hypothetical protein|tara:strand:- start:266 stop:406 length:141 start_codon:yes stop_codon:yes gene_type:complete
MSRLFLMVSYLISAIVVLGTSGAGVGGNVESRRTDALKCQLALFVD